jgi:hypothetical protein
VRRGTAGAAPIRGAGRGCAPLPALAATLAALLVAAACAPAGSGRPAPAEPVLRLWTPGIVRWSGDRRLLGVAVENWTGRSVEVEEPAPRRVGVVIYTGPNDDRACRRDPEPGPATGEWVRLAPGDVRDLEIDLGAACGRIPPGEYRYEVFYDAPPVGAGPPLRLLPRYGQLVVEAEPPRSLERGSMGAGGRAPGSGPGPGGDGQRGR